MGLIELMPYYTENRNSIYPLAKKYREDLVYIQNMIEQDIKSINKANLSISMLTSTKEGEKEYEKILYKAARYWQDMEEAYSDEAAVSDDLSIDFMMDDYDVTYAQMINNRIDGIINAARKHYFKSMNQKSAQKVLEGMAAGDCGIILMNGDKYSSCEFLESWEKHHPGEKLITD